MNRKLLPLVLFESSFYLRVRINRVYMVVVMIPFKTQEIREDNVTTFVMCDFDVLGTVLLRCSSEICPSSKHGCLGAANF